MKNDEKELLRLGFYGDENGVFVFNGKHQTFIAKLITYNGPVYVSLYYQSKEIDERPGSPRKGLPYNNFIKDCCSDGSLERAIRRYDVEDRFIKQDGFCYTIVDPELLGKESAE